MELEESMEFLTRIVKYLFWLLVVSWSVALLRRALVWMVRGVTTPDQPSDTAGAAGPGAGGSTQGGLAARRLVRDPVCGMHVAEELSIPLREGGEMVHFCSMACRDKYASKVQRMAANA
jgi:YHS domain-containing protein